MADARFVHVKFKLVAEVGGAAFDDVVSMSATFGMNSIPTANIVVAVGKDFANDKLATIHSARAGLRPRDVVRVFLTMTPYGFETDKVPLGTFKIFEGYLSGIGYQRSHNNANYMLTAVHWLDDMNNSSALTGNWMPGSSYDVAQAALYNELAPGGAGVGLGTAQLDPKYEIVNIGNISSDLWRKTIQPIYRELARWAYGRQQELGADGDGGGSNAAAIGIGSIPPGALNRMPGNGAKYYSPLALDLSGVDENVQDAVRLSLQISNFNSFAYTTFWNKLIGEIAAQFFFAVSPAVDWALPVPFFAATRQEWKTINADEYSYANFNVNMAQILESVDVFYPINASMVSASGLGAILGATGQAEPLGFYPASQNQNKQGLKLYKEAPGWLSNPAAWQRMAPAGTGEGWPRPGDTAAPNFGAPRPPVSPPSAVIESIKSSKIAKKLAEHWYKTELLYQRYGEMSGYLRFDIAPGSILKIEMPPKDAEYGAKDKYMFATATQVSYTINAERAMAGTSFTLAHIRTEDENKDDNITANQSPLFKTKWSGGPLAERDGG